jgi:hypothetical protein
MLQPAQELALDCPQALLSQALQLFFSPARRSLCTLSRL